MISDVESLFPARFPLRVRLLAMTTREPHPPGFSLSTPPPCSRKVERARSPREKERKVLFSLPSSNPHCKHREKGEMVFWASSQRDRQRKQGFQRERRGASKLCVRIGESQRSAQRRTRETGRRSAPHRETRRSERDGEPTAESARLLRDTPGSVILARTRTRPPGEEES